MAEILIKNKRNKSTPSMAFSSKGHKYEVIQGCTDISFGINENKKPKRNWAFSTNKFIKSLYDGVLREDRKNEGRI